jgi:hypothetical protein
MENVKIIKPNIENIFIFDDRYVFSRSDNISDLNAKPDYYTKLGLFILSICGIMFLIVFVFALVYITVKTDLKWLNPGIWTGTFILTTILVFHAPALYRQSRKSVIYKKDILKIYINKTKNRISFKFKEGKKRVKIRYVDLPSDINEKEKIFRVLYENSLIDREHISQIINMKEGFLYIKDKLVSFVDFKLSSKNMDAVTYENGVYQLFFVHSFLVLFAVTLSIVANMTVCYIILGIAAACASLYLIFLYNQFIKCKSFYTERDKIAGFFVDDNDNRTLKIQYYTKNRQLKQKTLILSDTAPEKSNVEFVKKYFPDSPLIINKLL